ncbi:MAG: L-histidine N(alpha)-methyltransferase [Phycisphaerae bacterium]
MSSDPKIIKFDFEPETGQMREDVLRGLASNPKVLPSQYLYDEKGAVLFDEICETDDYYVTQTEISILEDNLDAIKAKIGPSAVVIEPGSGSGIKTRLLLEGLEDPAGYVPIDVAKKQLAEFASSMDKAFPDLDVLPICADFTGDYELPDYVDQHRKRIIYFPGSTIGNFMPEFALRLLHHMRDICGPHGGILIGVDLIKDHQVLERAYDDSDGVSRDFAMNYLVRLNRELQADFSLDDFTYEAPFNEKESRIEMALVSLKDQQIDLDGAEVAFRKGERIRTEVSYKFSVESFAALAGRAGLKVEDVWTDEKRLFSIQYLVPA